MSNTPRQSKLFGDLTALEWQALERAVKDAGKFRPALAEGPDQTVDFAIRVRGAVTVCGDQVAQISKKPKLEHVLGLVLMQLGPITRDKVVQAVEEAFDPATTKQTPYEPPDRAIELTENLLLRVTTREAQHRNGNVSGAVQLERIRVGRAHADACASSPSPLPLQAPGQI
jgi:hypothetical protein